jgi:S-DNA-T family DNA segregation ATPase FtsK/SpoIIIE
MMDKSQLDQQADALEQMLHVNGAPARVTGGNVTPRLIQFLLQPAPGIKVNKVEALSREIAIALGAPTARVKSEGGAVKVEVPRNDPQPVSLMRLCARLPANRIPLGAAVLGLADDGAPLLVRLPSPDVAHVLIAGTTGSGKTALVQTMIISLTLLHHRRQIQFVLIGGEFASLADLPHLLRPIVTQPDQAVDVLTDMVKLIETREQDRVIDPHIVIVIDEMSDLSDLARERLTSLVQRGHEAGLHVVGATQKPSSAVLGSIVKANFHARIVGRVTSADDARVAAGIGGTGAERLTGCGEFIAITGTGAIRFQAAYIAPERMTAAAQQLKRGVTGRDIVQAMQDVPQDRVAENARDEIERAVAALPRVVRREG